MFDMVSVNGEWVSNFIQNNKMIIIIFILLIWFVVMGIKNKNKIDNYIEETFKYER